MPIITTFLPNAYFSLSFDFRMSPLTQCSKVVDASDAACCVQSSWRNIDRLLRELPDGDDRAENQDRTNCHFDDVAALFFRANQKRVGGLLVLIFWLICCACLFFHDTTFQRHVNGRDDNDHQISATYGVRKVRHFRARSRGRVCDVDFIRFGEGFRFLSCVGCITRRNSRRNSGSPDPAIQRRNRVNRGQAVTFIDD